MKDKIVLLILLTLSIFPLAGCLSMNSYVDPTFGKTTYDDIKRPAKPYQWRIVGEFERNGKHLPKVDRNVQDDVERIVRASGIAVPTTDPDAPEFKVIVNNVADAGIAAAKGIGTGLTLGLVGNTVTDSYEMEVVLTLHGKVIEKSGYKHAFYTTVGNASGPAGLEAMTPSAAFGKVVEQMLLNALKDLENTGDLSSEEFNWESFIKTALFG